MDKNKIIADISVNSICNMRCKMCDIGNREICCSGLTNNWKSTDSDLSVVEWTSILSNLRVNNVKIIGTEPLLYKNIKSLLHVLSKNMNVSICTNGFLIDDNIKSLSKYCCEVIASIDNIVPEIHDNIRGVTGCFNKVFYGIQKISKKKGRPRINYTIMPETISGMIEMYEKARSLSIPIVFNHFNFISPETAAIDNCLKSNWGIVDLSTIDIDRLFLAIQYCSGAKFYPYLNTKDKLEEYYFVIPKLRNKHITSCGVIDRIIDRKRFCINSNGKYLISARCWINEELGNAKDGEISETSIKRLIEISNDIKSNGLFPSCQRLCCAGNIL